jgi:hypothetical protein
MAILFITFGDFVIQCFATRYCDYIAPSIFRALLVAGAVELMFEVAGYLKIYRKKDSGGDD